MKYIILAIFCCVVSTCGSFDATYTDKQGVSYHGGVIVPKTADPK